MTGPLVAVCPRTLSEHPPFADALADAGFTARWNRSGARLRGDDLRAFLDGASHAVVGVEELDAAWLPSLGLRVVAKYGVGLDTLDLPALDAAGVQVGWTPGVNRRAAAELTLGLMLAALRHVGEGDRRVRDGAVAGGWRPPPGRDLAGACVGVIGGGHVGLEVTRLLRAFGARVQVHDRRDRRPELGPLGAEQVPLDALLATSEVLTLHVPLDASTRGLLDGAALQRLPRSAVLVNVARGALVDEAALLDALETGHLGAAALDVRAAEPAAADALALHPRVLTTPHVGGGTHGAVAAMAGAALHNLLHPQSVTSLRARLDEGAIEPAREWALEPARERALEPTR